MVADFEIFSRDVVSVEDVANALGVRADSRRVKNSIHVLAQLGWLRPLATRGAYEFLPARGGPYAGGDPLLEARAIRAKRPDFRLAVIGSGAAFLRGFAERPPRDYTVAVDRDQGGSIALAAAYTVVKTTAERIADVPEFNGAPVSDATHLLIDAALWPSACGDLRDATHWLRRSLESTDPATTAAAGRRVGTAAAARMAYIAAKFDAPAVAAAVAATLPFRAKTFIGEADAPIIAHDARLGVDDHLGVASLG